MTINYRLSTYGFLAVPGHLPGNYGLADQITALDWVIANIEKFGGDPERITIAGQSAGAGSVRVMLGSPKAIGKFQGAVAMSNLGLDFALGLGSGYGTTYSSVREVPIDQFPLRSPRATLPPRVVSAQVTSCVCLTGRLARWQSESLLCLSIPVIQTCSN